jgi:hypothetical protein
MADWFEDLWSRAPLSSDDGTPLGAPQACFGVWRSTPHGAVLPGHSHRLHGPLTRTQGHNDEQLGLVRCYARLTVSLASRTPAIRQMGKT